MALSLEEASGAAFQAKLRLPPMPSTRLLLKRREVAELEQVLQSRRQEFEQRMESLARHRRQLGQRREQLHDALLEFDAFLKDSAGRREQAAQAQAARHGAEVARLRWELEGLQRHRERLAQRLQRLCHFEGYLRAVLATLGQFQDIPDMLAHFRALAGAQAAVAQETEARREQVAQGRARLQQHQGEVGSEILRTSDKLPQLQARLEAARQDVLQEESRWAHVQSMAAQKTLLLGQIKLAVLNLFQLATAWLQVPTHVALEDTEAQLDMVLLCMQDLAAVCAELCARQAGPCPPRSPLATSTRPLCHRGARVPSIQE